MQIPSLYTYCTIFSLLLSLASFSQQDNFVVVSDYDDTFRITGYKTIPKIWNALYTDKVYAGNTELYTAFKQNATAIYFVSNSPEMLRKKIIRRISKLDLQPDSFFLYHGKGKKFDYKLASIKKIAAMHPNTKLILLGDNATEDHCVYDSIRQLYPKQIAKIYIRTVRSKWKQPEDIFTFYTAFEIAVSELDAGRLSKKEILSIGKAITNASIKELKPNVLHLPAQKEQWQHTIPEVQALQKEITSRLWNNNRE